MTDSHAMSRAHYLRKRVVGAPIQRVAAWYISKDRTYRYDGQRLVVPSGIFHPGLFGSTKSMLRYLERSDSRGQRDVLEIGAGSGLISMVLASRGHRVTATDISARAIGAITANAWNNTVSLAEIVRSNLFECLPVAPYDLIVITPPYYQAEPVTESDYAWYCGAELQYFRRLFRGLAAYCHPGTEVVMVLSAACPIGEIDASAHNDGWRLHEVARPRRFFEAYEYILRIEAVERTA